MVAKENIYRNMPEFLMLGFDPYSIQQFYEESLGSQEPEPEYVDLGLPSGTLWAKANLGALSEIDYGKYYDYASVGIEHLDHPALYTGTESPHNGQRDSATVILGASWKTPTRQQLNELFRSTTVAWVGNYNGSGVDGVTCTGKNGNSIFIPAAGAYHAIHDLSNEWVSSDELTGVGSLIYLWSCNPWDTYNYDIGIALQYIHGEGSETVNPFRQSGFSIRPVKVTTFMEDRTDLRTVSTSVGNKKFVDLGLPSGVLWATTNVGATYENGKGEYYQYGKGSETWGNTHSEADYTGVENPLSSSNDTATQVWGESFRTPTQAEFIELIENTTQEYVTDYKGTGTDGLVFTAQNGNYIFFPAGGGKNTSGQDYPAGYGAYWSSSPYGTTWTDSAKSMAFYLGGWIHCDGYFTLRKEGYCIRPVMESTT